jgi:16S rRNA (uracil1498-N3)-methyltransferase
MYFYLPTDNVSQIDKICTDHFFSMRVKAGDTVTTTDLNGLKREIKVLEAEKRLKLIRFEILSSIYTPQNKNENILFQAITDKIYLEKLVEIAPHADINTIYFFYSDRSPKGSINTDRLERILYRSCEQAQKMYKPKIEIIDNNTTMTKIAEYKPIILEIPDETISKDIKSHNDTLKSVLVGPEGGWSKGEIDLFKQNNLVFESLGSIIYPAWLAGYTWFTKTS